MAELSQKATEALATPPNLLGEFCDKNKKFLQGIERELNALSQTSAYYGEYISMRHGNGCGDQGNESARKEADKVVKKVRKALGYSYP